MLQVQIDAFSYSNKKILENIFFRVLPGQHISILGESGGGKTTLLHIIYGLLHLEHGEIMYKDRILLGPENTLIPGEPFMKLVAQEFNIMPYSTVAENIGSYLSRIDQEKDEKRIDELLDVVELTSYKNTPVKYLSGGQKQRVALAKALADEPEILLLDEPFSNVDQFLKNDLRRNLFQYLKSKNISCISATHDSKEALAFSDYILMLRDGGTERFDTPEKLYRTAENEYQGRFFGNVSLIPEHYLFPSGGKKNKVVYPDQLKVSKEKSTIEVQVTNWYFQGSHYMIQSDFNGVRVFFNHPEKIKIGASLYLRFEPN